MESLIPVIIQLVSGAVGGNAAGAAMKNLSLGTAGNSIVGILGGGIGGQILGMFGMATGAGGADLAGVDLGGMNLGGTDGMDMSSILGSVAGGGVGGGALLAVVGGIKKALGN